MNSNYVSFDKKEVPSIVKMDRFLPSYKFVNRIGVGKTGVVYKAIQTSLNRTVAIKVIPKSVIEQHGTTQDYCKKALQLAQLHHPCLMRIHDFGAEENFFYLVMEYVHGINLHDLFEEKTLSLNETFVMAKDIASALGSAHSNGIIHQAVCARNIHLGSQSLKLTDFQLHTGMNFYDSVRALGDIRYAAPEVVAKKTVDARADIYSLGVLMMKAITGIFPAELQAPQDSQDSAVKKMGQLYPIIYKCIRNKPSNRYKSIRKLEYALKARSAA